MRLTGHRIAAEKSFSCTCFARLAPGITLKQAQAQIQILSQRTQEDFPGTEKRWGASVRMLPDFLIHNFGIGTAAGGDHDRGGILCS